MNCVKCDENLNKGMKFCTFCGEQVIRKYKCQQCSNSLQVTDKFCGMCGFKVEQEEINFLESFNDIETIDFEAIDVDIDNSYLFDDTLKIGDIIGFGKYKQNNLKWVIIDFDERGNPLLFSEKVICNRMFDSKSNRWETSQLRQWLNNSKIYKSELYETGFLYSENFTDEELNMIKIAERKVIVTNLEASSPHGGSEPLINQLKKLIKESYYVNHIQFELKQKSINQINLNNVYHRKIEDKIFLISLNEIIKLYQNNLTKIIKTKYLQKERAEICYWLDTPITNHNECVYCGGYKTEVIYQDCINDSYGVRPALYLNKNKIKIKTGYGTSKSPYILYSI